LPNLPKPGVCPVYLHRYPIPERDFDLGYTIEKNRGAVRPFALSDVIVAGWKK
jgi:hypothetical protein